MNLTSRLGTPVEHDALYACLGADHPLARAAEWRAALGRQALVVAASGVVAAIGLLARVAAARPLLCAVAVAGLWLAAARVALRGSERARARVLIAQGREHVPVAAVRRERRRLAAPFHRERLAQWIETICAESGRRLVPGALPLFRPSVIRAVEPRLREIAVALRAPAPAARGVLRAEQLLENGSSPLYGSDPDALRRELGAIGLLLR